MAQQKSKDPKAASAPSKQPTVAELRNWYGQNQKNLQNFAAAEEAYKSLRDVKRTSNKTISTFSKETLRTYLQNISSNEVNLRNLSRYLYYRSHTYFRLVNFYANMFCFDIRSVVPKIDLVKGADLQKMLKSYYQTLEVLDKMNLSYELLKPAITCFREDVFYGCAYYDDTGLFILPLDPDYCKISGVYAQGDFSFSMDMSYFRSRSYLLELWGEPFDSMYRAFESDTTNGRWQPMPDEYAACFKFRAEDWETVIPPMTAIFNSLINLSDLEDIQAIAAEQEIYKMIWMELETIDGSKDVDDWKVDPDLAIKYFNRMVNDGLPDYVTAVIVPGKLNSIGFDSDKAKDTNKITDATEAVLNTAGGAEVLNGASISGVAAFNAAAIANTNFALSTLLPQFQSWVNRFLSYWVSNPSKTIFHKVSEYTKEQFKKDMLEAAQNSFPTKLAYNSANGFSALDTMALNMVEEQILKISQVFVPLQTSHTLSGSAETGEIGEGRPALDDTELTDDAASSREKRDTANE